jgi:hypothetical protein
MTATVITRNGTTVLGITGKASGVMAISIRIGLTTRLDRINTNKVMVVALNAVILATTAWYHITIKVSSIDTQTRIGFNNFYRFFSPIFKQEAETDAIKSSGDHIH